MSRREGGDLTPDQGRLRLFTRQLTAISKLSRIAALAWLVSAVVGFAVGNTALGLIGLFMTITMMFLSRF